MLIISPECASFALAVPDRFTGLSGLDLGAAGSQQRSGSSGFISFTSSLAAPFGLPRQTGPFLLHFSWAEASATTRKAGRSLFVPFLNFSGCFF
jgi:hypothetical protein